MPRGVEVDLDEAVDRVDRRRLVLHPGDVVRLAVGRLAGLVELDQRAQRLRPSARSRTGSPPRDAGRSRRSARRSGRRPGRPPRPACRPCFTSRELSGYFSLNPSRSFMRHADVEVVGAGGEDVLARRRRLVGDHRIDGGVEEHRLQPRQQRVERSRRSAAETSRRPWPRACAAAANASRRALQHELARRQVVVRTVVDPEQLGVALDLGERRRRRRRAAVRDDRLEHVAHLERVRVALVVVDVAPGDGRLVQVPDRASSPSAAASWKPSAYSCTTAASSTRSSRYLPVARRLSRRALRCRGFCR